MSDGYEAALESAEGRRTALYSVLGQVPSGKVVSYGQLAELAGIAAPRYWDLGEDDKDFKWNNYISRYHMRPPLMASII